MKVRHAALCLLLLICSRDVAAAGDPPYGRGHVVPLASGECQELRIKRVGAGALEVRFFAEGLPRPTGLDPKTDGASLMLDASDLERASLLSFHESGVYAASARLPAPIRWVLRDGELCVASGSRPVLCSRVSGDVLGTVRIAFGDGWESGIAGCAAFSMPERGAGAWLAALAASVVLFGIALRTADGARDVAACVAIAAAFGFAGVATIDPWRLPHAAILPVGAVVSGALAVTALFARRRPWWRRAPRAALGGFTAWAILSVPHPVWTESPVAPAVRPLWLDTANWQPRAPHQSLEFRGRPVGGIEPASENWLVLGGSVVFGDGVADYQAFPAVAQDLLRGAGDPKLLLNAGVQGWNIQNIDRLMEDLGDALPVKGIVLASILNNATLPIAPPPTEGCERSLVRAALCNASRNQLIYTWPKVVLPKRHNPERYRRTLRALLERELALGRRVVLLDEASEIDDGPIRFWNADTYREIAREVSGELGVPFHAVADALEALPADERFLDGIHPTPAAHAAIGRRLFEILRAQ